MSYGKLGMRVYHFTYGDGTSYTEDQLHHDFVTKIRDNKVISRIIKLAALNCYNKHANLFQITF